MNYNRILRATNFLFFCCGYQIQWFRLEDRICKLNVASAINCIFLGFWYAACFRQHFLDSSVFSFLISMAPILHKIIRLHLFMGLKCWLLIIFEMKLITRALNGLIKTLPPQTHFNWSYEDVKACVWLFSGLLINFGFATYIMFELNFRLPTLNQVMHGSALFLPHFALACSLKVLNLTSMFSRSELQNMHSKINDAIKNESPLKKSPDFEVTNGQNSVELSTPTTIIDLEIKVLRLETLQLSVQRLENLFSASRLVQQAIQKQIMFLFVMNSISLLGATYTIVNYKKTWHLILEESIGNSLYVFNIGVFVFILWDFFSLCVVTNSFEKEKSDFLEDVIKILRNKNISLEDDKRAELRDMKNLLKSNLNSRIIFNMPLTWQTLFMANALVGLAIAIYVIFHYLDDDIENLDSQINADAD